MDVQDNLSTLMQSAAAAHPERIAMINGAHKIPYAALARQIDIIAKGLVSDGVKPSMTVGIEIADWYSHLVSMMAVMRTGGIAASLGQREDPGHMRKLGFDIIMSTNAKSKLSSSPKTFIRMTDKWAANIDGARGAGELPPPEVAGRSLGRILFSSGTTGTPRGILIPAQSYKNAVAYASKGINQDTRFQTGYGMGDHHNYTLATWSKGGTVILGSQARQSREKLSQSLEETNFVSTSTASLVGILMSKTGEFNGRADRYVRVGGAPLPLKLRDEALARFCGKLETVYGSMETGLITLGDASLLDRHPGAVGFVNEGVELQIVDRDGGPVPVGETGNIRIRAEAMAQGYVNEPELTSKYFRDGWFNPGDIGVQYPDGMVAILGKDSDVLNVGGVKFSANIVEHEVLKIDCIRDACALAVANRRGVNTLVILVECTRKIPKKDLDAKAREGLAKLGLGTFIVKPVAKIPRNERGKIPRERISARLSKSIRI